MSPGLARFILTMPLVFLLGAGTPPVTAVSASQAQPFSFSWTGTPAQPLAWNPATGFDVVLHDRNFSATYDKPSPFAAQHGPDCGPFQGFGVGGTHEVTQYQDEVFICNNHLMTSVDGPGYAEITLTPGAMLDWSSGPVRVTWQADTLRTSCRDWLSFNVMPFADNLMLTDGAGVDLYGEPRNELLIASDHGCPTSYHGRDIRDFNATNIPGPGGSVSEVVSESDPAAAKNRQTFELDISSTHVRFGMPDFNKWFVDGALKSPLPYSQAVLQLEQHSYSPDKECRPSPTFCAANTWHWSNISISNGEPFTILRADRFQVAGRHTGSISDSVHFPAPAPANSYLRFEGVSSAGSVRFSTNGGQTWITPTHQQPAERNRSGDLTNGQAALYFWPIPAGTTQVKFDAQDNYWTWNAIRNISIWSTTPGSGVTLQPPRNNDQPATDNPPAGQGSTGVNKARSPIQQPANGTPQFIAAPMGLGGKEFAVVRAAIRHSTQLQLALAALAALALTAAALVAARFGRRVLARRPPSS